MRIIGCVYVCVCVSPVSILSYTIINIFCTHIYGAVVVVAVEQ